MKIALNKAKSCRDRYYLIDSGMGQAGTPTNHANHKYSIVNGIDRGNGYQGHMAISYALNECNWLPAEAKDKIIHFLQKENLIWTKQPLS